MTPFDGRMTSLQTHIQPLRLPLHPHGQHPASVARKTSILVIVSICAVAALAVLYATRESIGLSPDSRGYLMAAHSVREGRGVRILDSEGRFWPMTQLAPLYSVLLAGVSWLTP